MTVTNEILSIPATTSKLLIDVYTFDNTKWAMVGDTISTDRRQATVEYVYEDADPRYPIRARMQINVNPSANEGLGQVNYSAKIEAVMVQDTDGVVDWEKPISATLAWTVPGTTMFNMVDTMQLLGGLFNFVAGNSVASQVPSTVKLAKLANGIAFVY